MTTVVRDRLPSPLYDSRERRRLRWWPEMTRDDQRRIKMMARIDVLVDEVELANLQNGPQAPVDPHLVLVARRIGAQVPATTVSGSKLHEALMDFAEEVSPPSPEDAAPPAPVTPRPPRTHNRVTPEMATEMRRLVRMGMTRADVARQFGVAKSTVTNIVHTEWKEAS